MSLGRSLMRVGSRNIRLLPRQLITQTQNFIRHETGSVSNSWVPLSASSRMFSTQEPRDVQKEIGNLVVQNKVVIFMKGVPEAPRCGFSNAVVQILRMHDVTYDAHNVLEDEELRQGIKDFSSWPTIPQVFMEGEFIGGCDILLQMHQSGELVEELQKIGIRSALLPPEDEKK